MLKLLCWGKIVWVLEFLYYSEVGMKELSEDPVPLAREEKQRFPSKRPSQTGAYQSKIFTFLQRQTYRLRDGFGQSWRQVRVSVQMTGQLLLLPLRLLGLWQANKNQPLPGKNAPPLPPIAEQPAMAIERLLAEVSAAGYGQMVPIENSLPTNNYEDWSSIDEREWDVTLLDPAQRPLAGTTKAPALDITQPIIRGLASRLRDRHLLLVDDHNQVLDVLSPSQQLHIRRRIDPHLPPLVLTTPARWRLPGTTQPIASLPTDPSTGQQDYENDRLIAGGRDDRWWQKLSHWFNFYREYLRVEIEAEIDAVERETPPDSAPGKLAKNSIDPAGALQTQAPTVQAIAPSFRLGPKAIENTVFTPEWIEAPTRPLGYERSWLMRLLEWLDGLVLAIENWIVSCYHRLFDRRS
jgi:hypothetical protein